MLRILCALCVLCAISSHATTLLVYGDSLSAGYQLAPEQSWPALLAARWQQQGVDMRLINASVSGETTQGGQARLAAALQSHQPDWVLLELGANDGLRGLPVKAMATNLQAMVDASRKAGAQVLLVGMRMPPNYGPEYTSRFEAAYRDIARANRLRLVPFMMEGFADQPGYFQADGLHPVAAAQPLILDTIWRELKPLLR